MFHCTKATAQSQNTKKLECTKYEDTNVIYHKTAVDWKRMLPVLKQAKEKLFDEHERALSKIYKGFKCTRAQAISLHKNTQIRICFVKECKELEC